MPQASDPYGCALDLRKCILNPNPKTPNIPPISQFRTRTTHDAEEILGTAKEMDKNKFKSYVNLLNINYDKYK